MTVLDVSTTPLPRASAGIRLASTLVGGAFALGVGAVAALPGAEAFDARYGVGQSASAVPWDPGILWAILASGVVLSAWSTWRLGGPLGARGLGLVVTDNRGRGLGFGRSLARTLAAYVGLAFAPVGIGSIVAFYGLYAFATLGTGRSPADLLTGAHLVRGEDGARRSRGAFTSVVTLPVGLGGSVLAGAGWTLTHGAGGWLQRFAPHAVTVGSWLALAGSLVGGGLVVGLVVGLVGRGLARAWR